MKKPKPLSERRIGEYTLDEISAKVITLVTRHKAHLIKIYACEVATSTSLVPTGELSTASFGYKRRFEKDFVSSGVETVAEAPIKAVVGPAIAGAGVKKEAFVSAHSNLKTACSTLDKTATAGAGKSPESESHSKGDSHISSLDYLSNKLKAHLTATYDSREIIMRGLNGVGYFYEPTYKTQTFDLIEAYDAFRALETLKGDAYRIAAQRFVEKYILDRKAPVIIQNRVSAEMLEEGPTE